MQTDSELLEAFRRMHPTYTVSTLCKVLCVKKSLAYLLIKDRPMEEYQRRLLRLYLELPEHEREKHFA